ncbi:hypothetical protein BG004_005478 [Podila humilis]|nr:hypothetical protein BG004_005478 [Podila humilis]
MSSTLLARLPLVGNATRPVTRPSFSLRQAANIGKNGLVKQHSSSSRLPLHFSHNGTTPSVPHVTQKLFGTHALTFHNQATRGFSSKRVPLGDFRLGLLQRQQHQQLRRYTKGNYGSSSNNPVTKRRPFRFLFKWLTVSSAVVAIPAAFVFGPAALSILAIPLGVGVIVGSALVFSGGFLFIVLPGLAIASVAAFWTMSLPAAMLFRELDQIIKRDRKGHYTTALSALGSEWTVEASRPDEYFLWTFPKDESQLDKAEIRMAIFDPNDNSGRKQRMAKLFEFVDRDSKDDILTEVSEKGQAIKLKNNSNVEYRNSSSNCDSTHNLEVRRVGDHVEIKLQDDGAKMMKQKWVSKYVELGKVVDRAASETEQMQGVTLGNQVVLVHRKASDWHWDKFSIYGHLAPRIPFDRRWIHDVADA